MKTEVTFIQHSGFSVSLNQHLLLFDYYRGQLPGNAAKKHKYSVAFASHSHGDHYNPKIFNLSDYNPGSRYVLSYEIDKKLDNSMVQMKPGDRWVQPDIEVYAFGSTDIGVSYGIICEGVKIFHAGDLNLWSWKEVSTDEEIADAYHMFAQELDQIALFMDEFDIAFFPVDPRLRIDCEEGAKMFLDAIKVNHLFPMHLWGKFKIGKNFQNSYEGGTIIHAPEKTGQTFILDID